MNLARILCIALCMGAGVMAQAQAQAQSQAQRSDAIVGTAQLTLVNLVIIGERIYTGGQPTAEGLAALDDFRFDLVVNLAPPTTPDAIADEGRIVAADGLAYVNIPVNWQQPTAGDFDLFSAVMNGARDKKVLVHCQLNMRASAFTFLYRVVHEGVAPEAAFADLSRVWVPRDQWADFVHATLAAHDIDYRLPATAPAAQ